MSLIDPFVSQSKKDIGAISPTGAGSFITSLDRPLPIERGTKITEFVSEITKSLGLARSNRFFVQVFPPPILANIPSSTFNLGLLYGDFGIQDIGKLLKGDFKGVFFPTDLNSTLHLALLCQTAQLPGLSISTQENRNYGPTYKTPYTTIYEDVTLDFLCTNKTFEERKFFDAWVGLVMDKTTHDLNYYDEYTSQIQIFQLDGQNAPIYQMQLDEAYPIVINAQELSQDEAGLQKLSITFTFRKWHEIKPEPDTRSKLQKFTEKVSRVVSSKLETFGNEELNTRVKAKIFSQY